MNNAQINVIKDISRLKVVFTIESTKPLSVRVFSRRGLNKVQRNLQMRYNSSDDNYEEVVDYIKDMKIKVFFKKEMKIKKSKTSKRKRK